jgi:hypothetical protein
MEIQFSLQDFFCKIIALHLGPWADSGADPVQDMYILVIGPDPNKIGLQ